MSKFSIDSLSRTACHAGPGAGGQTPGLSIFLDLQAEGECVQAKALSESWARSSNYCIWSGIAGQFERIPTTKASKPSDPLGGNPVSCSSFFCVCAFAGMSNALRAALKVKVEPSMPAVLTPYKPKLHLLGCFQLPAKTAAQLM